jgi:hypothetical protein
MQSPSASPAKRGERRGEVEVERAARATTPAAGRRTRQLPMIREQQRPLWIRTSSVKHEELGEHVRPHAQAGEALAAQDRPTPW